MGITIKVSTRLRRALIPSSACLVRLFPSKLKGRVTTPTVKQPISLATSAAMGAAPVPVPPPIPEVINTRSVFSKAWAISSRDSSAAFCPIAGFPPAPRPLVILCPICNFCSAAARSRA